MVRKTSAGVEIERVKVPIIYAPKEKYITRLLSDPELNRSIGSLLPRMSFDITSINYDPSRKQNTLLRTAKGNTASRTSSQYMGVPYDIGFELNIYAKNIDDGNHIVEQILPYFTPDYTIAINPVPEVGFVKDIPIVLNGINNTIEHEGNFDSVRYVTWTLTFNMKTYFFGPVSTPKIIRKVITNIYNDPSIVAGYVSKMNMESGNNGKFEENDIVYQGTSYESANAYGTVISWSANTGKLMVGGSQGQFKTNNTIRALSTNAQYQLASFDLTPLKLAKIVIQPDPITAGPEDAYGYDTVITEFPNIED